jgi:hypothetical protein
MQPERSLRQSMGQLLPGCSVSNYKNCLGLLRKGGGGCGPQASVGSGLENSPAPQ